MEILIPLFIIVIVNIFNKLLETANKEQEKQQGRRSPVVIKDYEKMKDEVSSPSRNYEDELTSTFKSESLGNLQDKNESINLEETKNLQMEKLAAQMNIQLKEEPTDSLGGSYQSRSLSTSRSMTKKTSNSHNRKDTISRNLTREGLRSEE